VHGISVEDAFVGIIILCDRANISFVASNVFKVHTRPVKSCVGFDTVVIVMESDFCDNVEKRKKCSASCTVDDV